MSDPRREPPWQCLQAAAARVGGHRWIELQVFEVAGRWVPETPEPGAKLALDRHSGHAAWRAGEWEDRLPLVAGMERAGLVRPPDDGWARAMAELAALESTVARLAGLYRVVLPRLAGRYRAHRAASAPATDGPVRRTLAMALTDVGADRDEGEDVLAALVDAPGAAEAAAAVARIEAALVAPGVLR